MSRLACSTTHRPGIVQVPNPRRLSDHFQSSLPRAVVLEKRKQHADLSQDLRPRAGAGDPRTCGPFAASTQVPASGHSAHFLNLRQRVEITSNLLELQGHVDATDIISALHGGCEQA